MTKKHSNYPDMKQIKHKNRTRIILKNEHRIIILKITCVQHQKGYSYL